MKRDLLALALIGVASGVVYLITLARVFPLLQMYANPPITIERAVFDQSSVLSFAFGMTVLFILYGIACRIASKTGRSRGTVALVVAFAALFAAVAVFIYPLTATDVYGYFFFGRILEYHHLNPLVIAPEQLPSDPLIAYAPWPDAPYPYGPLWAIVSGALAFLAGDNLLLAIVLFKALQLLAYLGSTVLIYRCLKKHGEYPPAAGALFFAWNPLVVFEMMGNAHNDGLVAFLIVLAAYAVLENHARVGLVLLVASALVKLTPAVLFPVFLVYIVRRSTSWRAGVREGLAGTVLAALVVGALYAPFWAGSDLLIGIMAQKDRVYPSLPATVVYLLEAYGLDAVPAVLTGARLLFLLIEFGLLWQLWRRDRELYQGIFDVFLALLLIATSWFQPWYLLSLLAVAPMCDAGRRKVAAVFSASALTIYLFSYVAAINHTQMAGTRYVLLLGYAAILTIFAPLALTAFAGARKNKKLRVVTGEA